MKHVSIMAAILVVGNVGLAVPGFELLQSQIQGRASANSHVTRRANGCTNFSGSWKGKCSIGSEISQEAVTNIQQNGCDTVLVGTEIMVLGGLDTRVQNNPTKEGKSYSTSTSMTSDWNADQTQVETSFTGLIKVAGTQGFTVLNGTGVMKLDGSKLVSDTEILGVKVNCVYEK